MESHNSFEWLLNFGSSTQGILLVAAPFGLMVIIGIVVVVLAKGRQKQERADLEAAMRQDATDRPEAAKQGLAGDDGTAEADGWADDFSGIAGDIGAASGEDAWTGDFGNEELAATERRLEGPDGGAWLTRLRSGLDKTRASLHASVASLFSGNGKIDDSTLEKLHEVLYRSDLGGEATDRLVAIVRKAAKGKDNLNWESIRAILRTESIQILSDVIVPADPPVDELWVILVVGVNGVGKTTTIGKLATFFTDEGMSVVLCAADTFRAAAIDQLKVWGQRIGVPVIAKQEGGDPAAVVFDAIASAKAKKADVLIIDTAGRLHSKHDLMDELEKIYRVIKREIPAAPHDAWLVIDATTGQNAFAQVKAFKETAKINGLIVTKLDGTAKGGVVLGICEQFKLPIRFLGVGEKAEDLNRFEASEFVDMLFD
jgi:fused signal recognition particle receptor